MSYLDYYRGKQVVVAGGGGFLGSGIAEILREHGIEVLVPRTKDGLDFRKYDHCVSYLTQASPHVVINCAANQGGIGYHEGKQAELFMDNMTMGLFLMQAAQRVGADKFINVVAGCSYPGYLEKEELNEEDYWNGEIHHSIFSYGFPRKATVVYGLCMKKQLRFNSIHLIMANMYGPGEHFHPDQSKALAALIRKVYEAKKQNASRVEVWGTGKPVRDWLYVKDGAEGILRAGAVYNEVEPLNIGTGVGISVADLANLIKRIIGYEGELFYNTQQPDGAQKKTFGIRKMREQLSWVPETPLEEGIRETVEWFDKNYDYAISQ